MRVKIILNLNNKQKFSRQNPKKKKPLNTTEKRTNTIAGTRNTATVITANIATATTGTIIVKESTDVRDLNLVKNQILLEIE